MAADVTITQFQDGIYLASRPLDASSEVRAALLLGARRAAVIDTMTCPEDMAPFLALLADYGRPYVVVNTHADWDHYWGNAAFPNVPIIANRLARRRVLEPGQDVVAEEAEIKAENPAQYAHSVPVAPEITFESALSIDLGGLTLELHHLPGHTADCLLCYVPERRLVYAGDCAEDPIPYLYDGPLHEWIVGLRHWAERDVETVVPAHGGIGGVELLRGNAAYLESVAQGAPLPPHLDARCAPIHAQNLSTAARLATLSPA